MPNKSRRKASRMNKKAVIKPDASPLTLKLFFYSLWNSSELWKESAWQSGQINDRLPIQTDFTKWEAPVKSCSEWLLRYERHSEGEVWRTFVWASTAQPTTHLGGEPTATDEKPSSPNASLKVTLHCPGHSNPQHLPNKMPHTGGHQGSLDRPRWNPLLLEQMEHISKFRTSSCS